MVTSFFPLFFLFHPPPPLSLECCPLCAVVACHSLVRHMAYCCDKYHAQLPPPCCHGFHIATLFCMFAYMIFPPKVPMVHGATPATVSAATTSATSVPFAATATANQVCSFTALFLKNRLWQGSVQQPWRTRTSHWGQRGIACPWGLQGGALIAWGFKDTSCWPTHSFYDEQQNAFMPFINAPKLSQLHF